MVWREAKGYGSPQKYTPAHTGEGIMLIIGLTGSIGMGKSVTASMFSKLNVPVYDADAAVHALYAQGGTAVAALEAAFPGIANDGAVDRTALSSRVLNDANALKRLEAIVHPLVGEAQMKFLALAEQNHTPMVVLDIPLLFETNAESRVDVTVVVSAPQDVQRARVLARAGMTEEKFHAIVSMQMPDAQKRAKATIVIETGLGFDHTFGQVSALVAALKGRKGTVWEQRRAGNRSGHGNNRA
jgi:dephospho-CoA kinase